MTLDQFIEMLRSDRNGICIYEGKLWGKGELASHLQRNRSQGNISEFVLIALLLPVPQYHLEVPAGGEE